ncbi:hypothetical protein GW17_00034345 [Ensete ventricosum]|nr:hypothetical protein GW17_00034345 [Ensete ventricosum]
MTIPARSKSGDGNHTWPGRDYGSLTYGLALFGLIGAAAATIAVMAIPLSYLFFGVLLSTIGIQEHYLRFRVGQLRRTMRWFSTQVQLAAGP